MDDVLVSLRELNRRFLALAGTPGAAATGAPAWRFAQLDETCRAAAADCPYALFDLRFRDEAHWSPRLRDLGTWHVADAQRASAETLEFVRVALFYVWHIATSAPLRAQLLLGMPPGLVRLFARLTVDRLPSLAVLEAGQLMPRWHTCDAYWDALLGAARSPGSEALRRAQLRGIQYAAAQCLVRGGQAAASPLRPRPRGG